MKYQKWMNEIIDKMSMKDYMDNTQLKNEYLLGYHHFTAYMYTKSQKEEA